MRLPLTLSCNLLSKSSFKAGLLCLLMFCFFLSTLVRAYAQTKAPVKQWDKTFGGSNNDRISSQIKTTDGGYLLGGSSFSGINGEKSATSRGGQDFWIVKVDANGNKQWDKSFGGSADDWLSAMIATPDGGYLLAGTSASPMSGDKTAISKGGQDFWIIKIDGSGNKQWDKVFGGNLTELLSAMVATTDGGYILGGSSFSGMSGDKSEPNWPGGDDQNFWIIKISSSGIKQWDKTYGFEINGGEQATDGIISILKTTDGNYLIGGTSEGSATRNFEVIKINTAGATLSQKHFEAGRFDRFTVMTLSWDGGYLLGGYEENIHGGFYKYFIIKMAANGNQQWKKSFGGPDNDNGEFADNDSYLTTVIETSDKGYLLAGRSNTPTIGDKTEQSRGGYDYWLVKVDKEGNKQWDKTLGGNADDVPASLLETSDKAYLISGNSSSANNGDKTQPSRGNTDFWIVKTTTDVALQTCTATGTILREVWNDISGSDIATIPVTKLPTGSSQLSSFQAPANTGDNYGSRIRGYICAPVSGAYTFYLSGDNNCTLYLSTDDKAENKTLIASIAGFTYLNQWNKYSSQKSSSVVLQQGKRYYIEALQKETNGGDHLSVGWQTSATSPISVIPGSVLSPFISHNTGKISREFWANVTGYQISNIPFAIPATTTDQITSFERATNQGDNYGQRFRGYLHPQVSGNYRFYMAGDDKGELWLSSDEDPSKKVKVASVASSTSLRQWNKYASQQSAAIALVAGRKYYIEALHKENTGNDNISVGWQLPFQTTIAVIAGAYLSPFLTSPTSNIARVGVQESLPARVNLYPNPFESKLTLVSEQTGKFYISVVDNLGRTVYQSSTQAMSAETTLGLDHLKAGVYVVKVSTEEGSTQVLRVVKQ